MTTNILFIVVPFSSMHSIKYILLDNPDMSKLILDDVGILFIITLPVTSLKILYLVFYLRLH